MHIPFKYMGGKHYGFKCAPLVCNKKCRDPIHIPIFSKPAIILDTLRKTTIIYTKYKCNNDSHSLP